MTEWVTHREAAELLGCHVSNVPKLVAKGHLTPRGEAGRKLPSLDLDQVVGLAERRAAPRKPRRRERVDHRPDQHHDWLSPREVAQLVGITKAAVMKRIHREQLPTVATGGRFWIRRDHLEQIEAARLVARTRRPEGFPTGQTPAG